MAGRSIPLAGDPGFSPIELFFAEYEERAAKGEDFWIALERKGGKISVHKTRILWEPCEDTYLYIERTVKSLLWIRGGFRFYLAGALWVYERLARDYASGGARAFDMEFMAGVYERPIELLRVPFKEFPREKEESLSMGGHLDGSRIGFDAGGSDRKVSAVLDGEVVFSEEVVWHPKVTADPDYHFQGITDSFKAAAAHLPRIDAIGISSAGLYIENKTMAASLFLKVPKDLFDEKVKDIYPRACASVGCDNYVVCNDGDVAALAGAMEVGHGNLMGIAMGTSEAGGYVNEKKNITGWLNELAFVPVDLAKDAMVDEWSGDAGCGVKYFSQDAVIKLATALGFDLDAAGTPGGKLKIVQGMLAEGKPEVRGIYETIGAYLAYGVQYYTRYYVLDTVMLMGRVMSGLGGEIILKAARQVLAGEFPGTKVQLVLPDEKSRRVGQSVAAASLPDIG